MTSVDHESPDLVAWTAPGLDAGSFLDWVALTSGSVPVRRELTDLDEVDLSYGLRAVAIVEAGGVLSADAAEGAAALLRRPAETGALVAVGADAIESADDVALVERALWQTVVGDGQHWSGQDLLERRCVLWRAPDAQPGGPIEDRLTRDLSWLSSWLTAAAPAVAPAPAHPEAESRGAATADPFDEIESDPGHVSSSPEDASATAGVDRERRVLAGARHEVTGLAQQLGVTIAADLASARKRQDVDILTLEQDLRHGVLAELDRPERVKGSLEEARALVGRWLGTEITLRWASGERHVRDQLAGAIARWLEILDDLQTARADAALPDVDAVIDRLRTTITAPFPPLQQPLSVDLPTSAINEPARGRKLRVAAYWVAVTGVAGLITGPVLLPVAAVVGVAGAAGGWFVDREVGDRRVQDQVAAEAGAAIERAMEKGRAATGLRWDQYAAGLEHRLADARAELDVELAAAEAGLRAPSKEKGERV